MQSPIIYNKPHYGNAELVLTMLRRSQKFDDSHYLTRKPSDSTLADFSDDAYFWSGALQIIEFPIYQMKANVI